MFRTLLATIALTLTFIVQPVPALAQGPNPHPPIVVIVGALSSGNLMAQSIRQHYSNDRRNPDPILIHVPDRYPFTKDFAGTFRPDDFDYRLTDPNPKNAIAEIDEIVRATEGSLEAVIGPYEGSVGLADTLSEHYHLLQQDLPPEERVPTNGTLLSLARQSKDAMMRQVHPLRTPFEFVTDSPEEAAEWAHNNGLFKRGKGIVVVKPVRSAGTVGVHFETSAAGVRRATENIIKNSDQNIFGEANQKVTVQEYLDGKECVVNVVSGVYQGKVYRVVTDVWIYHKRKGATGNDIYFYDDLIHPDKIPPGLIDYVYGVMDRLEIKTGWGHAEVKQVESESGQESVLVEIGSRPMGSGQPGLVEQELGFSQINLGVLAYLDPKAFAEYADKHPVYTMPKDYRVSVYTLKTPGRHLWLKADAGKTIELEIGTLVKHRLPSSANRLERTTNLENAAGEIWLSGSESDVAADIAKLQALERNGELFERHFIRSISQDLAPYVRGCLNKLWRYNN